ncbi:segregation and condensation protein B-like [Oratosquilla oratoria]|uniref:segregation and condensation protein B-like n=1 Tax=Oratosquilla oratoria TaxID=337810 RepID=UPI003F7580C6
MNKTINVSLTKSVLEALTIIAYKQPTTKSDIEQVRGVSADYAISKLLEYELIESNERADLPGKPRLYVTTQTFLELFDINSLNDLPEVSKEFEEKTQETTLFSYDADEEKLIAEAEAEKQAAKEAGE